MQPNLFRNQESQAVREIRGLSLTRPWPFAFIMGPTQKQKRVENRSWKPPASLIGCRVALHSAKSWDESARSFIADILGRPVLDKNFMPHSQIFAVCSLAGFVTDDTASLRLSNEQLAWYFGPFGWTINDLVELDTPVECKGALGLWHLPSPVLIEVTRQYEATLERQRTLAAIY